MFMQLAFFLGGLGHTDFIENNMVKALLYILFCWTGIPGVIGMIEGVIAFIKLQMSGNI